MTDELILVEEGKAKVHMHAGERAERGPASKEDGPVFYNPAMATNRDLSALLMRVRAKPEWTVLDGLAASGLRGLRYALESGVPLHVELNDWNPVAVKLLEENVKLNGLEARVTRRNLAALLQEQVWHAIDLDPFGSPAPFLDAAARAVRDGGLLGITATDTTALAGVYPNVCRRRYHSDPLHGELGHEVALRILAASAVRAGARHDVAYTPIFAHATDHYYRLSLACRRGAQRADDAMEQLGFIILCAACGHRSFADRHDCPECGGPVQRGGPLWTGALLDEAVVDEMAARTPEATFARWRESRHLLNVLLGEARALGQPDSDAPSAGRRAPWLFFDIHKVGERLKVGSPATAAVVAGLEAIGRRAFSVHFNRLAIRTDATAKEINDVVRAASRTA